MCAFPRLSIPRIAGLVYGQEPDRMARLWRRVEGHGAPSVAMLPAPETHVPRAPRILPPQS